MLENILIKLDKFLYVSFCFGIGFKARNSNDVEGPGGHGIPVLGNDAISVSSDLAFAATPNLYERELPPRGACQDPLLVGGFAGVRQIRLDTAPLASEQRTPLLVARIRTPDLDRGHPCAGQFRYLPKALLAVQLAVDEFVAVVRARYAGHYVVLEALGLHRAVDDADGVYCGRVLRAGFLGVSLATPVVELRLGGKYVYLGD